MSIQTVKNNVKLTTTGLQKMKGQEPIVMVTAYDALFAKLFDGEVEMILVGDSLNHSFAGKSDTLSATLDQMIYHTNAVCTGAPNTFVVLDMPFGTYSEEEEALSNAVKVYKETTADAVKVEGGADRASIVAHLAKNSIAVVGHIGLMPQYVRSEGGYKVRGKTEEDIAQLVKDAKAIEEAGAFCLVVEGVKSEAAQAITEAVKIPTIGIGAGKDTDGQVLVWSDMFGFFEAFKPKFVREYLDGASLIKSSIQQYNQDVKSRAFPDENEMY